MKHRLAAAILIVGFLSRVVPHAWDFTPVLALALFAGANLPGWQRFAAPLGLMALTDCVLGFYPSFLVTWAGVLAGVVIGTRMGAAASWARVSAGSVGAAVVFYVVSNFGVWLTDYPKTWAGLTDCFVLALPFFRNSLLSTLIYGHALIGGYAWFVRRTAAHQTATQHT